MTGPTVPRLSDDVSLGDARSWLELKKHAEGVHCPCCGQFAKVYWRTITSAMARALIILWRAGGTDHWVHGPTLLGGARADEGKLRYWGLLQESKERRDDGGRAGYWRVTEVGESFIRGKTVVPQYALVYDGACLDFAGAHIGIRDALGTRFNYEDLMNQPVVPRQKKGKK